MNEITHEYGAFTKGLLPVAGQIEYSSEEIERYGSEDNTAYIYTFMAALKAAGNWLDSLKEIGVYDNTRIVIVSDHGYSYDNTLFESGMTSYNPLLMVKEPGAQGALIVSDAFMTQADLPSIVTAGMEKPVNPWSGAEISPAAKKSGVAVVSEVSSQVIRHGPYRYNLVQKREFQGTDIFHSSAWGPWEEAD
jgi:arylsulfatase A-like enzyme